MHAFKPYFEIPVKALLGRQYGEKIKCQNPKPLGCRLLLRHFISRPVFLGISPVLSEVDANCINLLAQFARFIINLLAQPSRLIINLLAQLACFIINLLTQRHNLDCCEIMFFI